MSTQPLIISQGALLPMPPDRPVQTDTGYTETPDSLTTTGYTDRPVVPQPVNVAFPHPSGDPTKQGPVVQFPDEQTAVAHSPDVWSQLKSAVAPSAEFLGNEAEGLGASIVGLPSAIADSVAVQPTAEEQKNLGVSADPSLAEKSALALWRNLGEPVSNATAFYKRLVQHNQSLIDAIPQDVLAQGLGAGAGAVVLGKALGAANEESPAVTKAAPVKAVAPVAPMTEAERAAAAYTHKIFGPDTADVQLLGHQGSETPTSELKHGTSVEREGQAASQGEVDEAADKEIAKLQKSPSGKPNVSFETHEGRFINRHRASINIGKAGEVGHVEAVSDPANPDAWRINSVDLDPEFRGKGLGVQAYEKLAKEADKAGVSRLESGGSVSPEATRVWQALSRRGHMVQKLGTAENPQFVLHLEPTTKPTIDLTHSWESEALKQLGDAQ